LVFVSAGSTYALGSDGEIQWKRPDVNAQTGSFPAVADGKVLFCSESGFGDEDPPPYLYALDAETGQTEWRTEFAEDFSVSPTIVDRTVDDGSLQWTVEFEKLARGTPAADEDVVVSGSESVYVLDADSGKKHWSKPITISGSPTLTDDTVYVGSNDAIYYALDRETGETRWKYDMDELTFGSTAVVGDTVYVTCGTAAYAFDRHSGEQQWQYRADGEASSPAVAGSTLFVGTAGKQLHAIDIDSGIRDFVVSLGSSAGHPVVTDGTVYVSTHDGLFVYTE
jgi:outer membrane protein assembly factor BamB